MAKREDSEYQARYRAERREQRCADSKEYYLTHKEQRKKYNAAYHAANREREAVRARARYERDKPARLAARKLEYAANPDKFKRDAREWRLANPRKDQDIKLRKYGITADDYDRILSEQGGICALCGDPHGDRRRYRLHVDHCHLSGVVRGLLCSSCNFGIGHFGDDPERFERVALYLRARGRPTPIDQQK